MCEIFDSRQVTVEMPSDVKVRSKEALSTVCPGLSYGGKV